MADPSDGRIGHAELKFGGSIVMLANAYPDFGALSSDTIGDSPVTLCLLMKSVDDDLVRAVDAGATVLRVAIDQSCGERNAMAQTPLATRYEHAAASAFPCIGHDMSG
ncbi:hypothetical protein [Pukyongiella litopenaei]|uniref:Uncharacterized protein n=1 Tax=Pukyongiella litopenaei TaxID=2605946 RepID=A0A2S0MN66_9RHOB|nr:hypothetical protein [Pukyongiella litopenaei]AVO37320.2 hypothetical protein C6Y53_06075 [Pukyongiella litopenaei]